jgi:uncharacterized Fe-S center protein
MLRHGSPDLKCQNKMSKQARRKQMNLRKERVLRGAVFAIICAVAWALFGFSVKAAVPTSVSLGTSGKAFASVKSANIAKVYMTADISPAGLRAVYEALGRKATGKVAVKIPTGEPTNPNHLAPDLIKDLVRSVNGTFVECNVAYGGPRASSAMHRQVAKDKGYIDIAPLDILDEEGSMSLPFVNGKNITENFVGSHFANYDFYVTLTHFKGHQMAGYGGALKNISIGLASAKGKSWIHSAGKSLTSTWGGEQDPFLESMAEAAGSVIGYLGNNIVYINVMNRISIDCDCSGSPAEPDIHDIGILSSLDPVALDQACIDLIYAAEGAESLIERIETQNGIHTIDHAATLGLGSKAYQLIKL